jgi:hypothetical protein
MGKALNIQECVAFAMLKGGKCIETEYVNNRYKMLWECIDGHRWRAAFDHIKNGSWCQKRHRVEDYGPRRL